MEKKTHELLQDWHELLKEGIITEKEFQEKKSKLLNITENKTISSEIRENKVIENKVIENKAVEIIKAGENSVNIAFNKFSEFTSKYKFYIVFGCLAIIMTLSYFKNFYKADKKPPLELVNQDSDFFNSHKVDLDLDAEIEKWKKELYLNKEVGPECIDDYNKWMEENPEYYYGIQETKTLESDFNSDGNMDYLVFMPAVNCVGGNGTDSDFGLLVYSNENEILTNKGITAKISEEIKIKLSDSRIYIDYAIFHYTNFNKTIGGEYYAWIENDAHCCPSFKGTFEYNLENGSIEIENNRNNN